MLPLRWDYDCLIDLQPTANVPYGQIYVLSEPELAALHVYIQENLANGFIWCSTSREGGPELCVKKKD